MKQALAALLVLLFAATPAFPAEEDTWTSVGRIVAIGDVHGDFDQFVALLRSAGLIDARNRWTGGETHLVQTGDVLDRGPDSRKAMDLLMNLERQARRAGGFVHALIGNHEAMNLYGDLRYVSEGEYAAFRRRDSERIRATFYEQHVEELKQNPPPDGLPEFDDAYRQKWEAAHPLGYFEHRVAFGPKGEYGKWIRDHNAAVKINDTLFLHGGISPTYSIFSANHINIQIRAELQDFSKLMGGMSIDQEGPLWYRGLAQGDQGTFAGQVDALLRGYGVSRIVIGHTPTPGIVLPRFGGKVVLIDVGLAAYYGGGLSCLVIEGDRIYALHRGKPLSLEFSGGADLLAYLKQAAALELDSSRLAPLIENVEKRLAVPASP